MSCSQNGQWSAVETQLPKPRQPFGHRRRVDADGVNGDGLEACLSRSSRRSHALRLGCGERYEQAQAGEHDLIDPSGRSRSPIPAAHSPDPDLWERVLQVESSYTQFGLPYPRATLVVDASGARWGHAHRRQQLLTPLRTRAADTCGYSELSPVRGIPASDLHHHHTALKPGSATGQRRSILGH
jgi:hypothetical protein